MGKAKRVKVLAHGDYRVEIIVVGVFWRWKAGLDHLPGYGDGMGGLEMEPAGKEGEDRSGDIGPDVGCVSLAVYMESGWRTYYELALYTVMHFLRLACRLASSLSLSALDRLGPDSRVAC